MSQSKINNHEQDLLALMQPFRTTEGQDNALKDEAQALLAFVDDVLTSGSNDSINNDLWHDYLDTTGRSGVLYRSRFP